MEDKIVLGFPYAGAFVWLLNAEEQYKKSIKESYDGTHPYYKTLFGKNHSSIIDETVSLTLLFDKIYLAPVDIYLPNRNKFESGESYINSDLGIYTSWEWVKEIEVLYNQINPLLLDYIIQDILKDLSRETKVQVMLEAINQIHVSNIHEAAIFAIPSYLKLCRRINQLLTLSPNLKTSDSTIPVTAVSTVFDVASLNFSIKNLEEFSMLKQEKDVKDYAESFRKYIKKLPDGTFDDLSLYEAMLNAMSKDKISDKISGGMGLTATMSGIASFFPPAAIIAGAVGLGADGVSRIAANISDNNKWWLMAPEISKRLTKHRIEKLYNEKKGSR